MPAEPIQVFLLYLAEGVKPERIEEKRKFVSNAVTARPGCRTLNDPRYAMNLHEKFHN